MADGRRILRQARAGSAAFLLVAGAALAASLLVDTALPRDVLIAAAAALATIFLVLQVATWRMRGRMRGLRRAAAEIIRHDVAPGLLCDEDGIVVEQNIAATERFGDRAGTPVARVLDGIAATPDAVVHRLRTGAGIGTQAREDVASRDGSVRVAVHVVPDGEVWRIEDLPDRPTREVGGSGLPSFTYGPSGAIFYMNEALRTVVGTRQRRVRELFETFPLRSGGLNRMTTDAGPVPVRIVLAPPGDGRQDAFVLPAGEAPDGRAGLDDLPVALLRLDPDGRVLSANRLARELLPASADGDEDRLAAMVEGLGRSVREWVAEAASGRGLYRAEVVRVTGAEVETYLQVTLGPPVDDDEGGLLAVLNDATELKTMEAQFVQSQKMQAIGQLAGGVAHDFNNLLTAISGHCDLLLLRHDEDDEDYADLTQITHNANRAAALVGQLLAFSRKQTLEMRPIDVRDALGDLAHLLNRLVGERVTLKLDHDPALIPIRGDRRQLEQVLMNLVVNARDAMPEGGEILIATRCLYLEVPMARDRVTVPPGQYVVIEVSDQGHGISADNLTRIFEPFFTTKRPGEGTGLGLSMAYGIVKQSGGFIFADSSPGGGTKFSLYFPATSEDDVVADPPAPVAAEPSAAATARDPAAPDVDPPEPAIVAGSRGHAAEGAGQGEQDASDVASDPDHHLPEGVEAEVEEPDEAELARWAEDEPDDVPDDADDEPDDARAPPRPEESPMPDMAHLLAAVAASRGGEAGPGGGASVAALPRQDARAEAVVADAVAAGPGASTARVEAVPEPEAVPNGKADPAAMPAKAVVLLVEDEAPVRAFASRALRLRGYEVMEAESAEAALDRLADPSLVVDVFVTDVMMPGLDGPTWVRRALIARPDVRTVFISGYTQDALSETSAPVPNAVFLPKPFSLADLTRTVAKVLQ